MPVTNPEIVAMLEPDEITPENWLAKFVGLDVAVEHVKNEAYRRGWADALSLVRCLAQHAEGQLKTQMKLPLRGAA